MLHRSVNVVGRRCPVSWTRHGPSRSLRRSRPARPEPPGRARRVLTVGVLVLLIVSMVVLAFVSGRGVVPVAAGPAQPPVRGRRPATVGRGGRAAGRRRRRRAACRRRTRPAGRVRAARRAAGSPTPSRPGRRTATASRSSARTDGTGIDVFAVGPAVARPGGPAAVYYERGPSAVLPLLVARRPAADVPDDRARRPRPPHRTGRRRAPPRRSIRAGAPMYWAWAEPTGCSSTAAARDAGAFFGEAGTDGVVGRTGGRRAGRLPRAGRHRDGRFRAYVGPGDGHAGQVVVEGAGPVRSAHAGRLRWRRPSISGRPARSSLSSRPRSGAEAVALPIGPLRLIDAATGDVRTLLDGTGRGVLLGTRRPDDRGPPGRRAGRRQRRRRRPGSSWPGRPGRAVRPAVGGGAPGVALRLVFVDVAERHRPVAARRPGRRRLRARRSSPSSTSTP